MLFKSKICNTQHYKASEYLYLIDSLMNLDESKVPQIKEKSVSLRGGKLIFECDTQGEKLQAEKQQQPTVPVVACKIGQKEMEKKEALFSSTVQQNF